jgi:DNA ligase-1
MNEDTMQHGVHWNGEDVSGWAVTQKFDGCRAFWDGSVMWTRGGKAIPLPQSWIDALPAGKPLDGEVYFGVDGQRKCASAVRFGKFLDGMTFQVFDVPKAHGDYRTRMATVVGNDIVQPVQIGTAASNEDALAQMTAIHAAGGEGLMLRHPAHTYHAGRTSHMLKMKGFID